MVRQYIGARYVPVFYENSDGTSAWKAGVIYEPLTIVTYNNNSYTSKKTVPANVGNPSDNNDYWVATGNFNQQIQDLTNRFSELESEVNEALLKDLIYYADMDSMAADFKKDNNFCIVISPRLIINDALSIALDSPAIFRWSETADYFEQELNNGGFAVLVPPKFNRVSGSVNAIDCIPSIIDIAYSYCGVNKPSGFHLDDGTTVTNVQYQGESGPYLDGIAKHQGIQCSQFVRAVLSGLYYECSTLADENNPNLECNDNYPFKSDNGYNLDLSASEMAHYSYGKGWFKFSNKMSDIEIGDLAFFKLKADEYAPLKWQGIGHVALCVGKGSNCIMFANAGGIQFIDGFNKSIIRPGYNSDAVDFICYSPIDKAYEDSEYAMVGCAHIPYNGTKIAPKQNIRLNRYSYTYNAGSANEPIYLIKTADAVHARFGMLTFKGYCATENNGAGFTITRGTAESAFPATGTEHSTVNFPIESITFPILWNCDGNSKVCTASFTFRLTDTTKGSRLLVAYANLDVYD